MFTPPPSPRPVPGAKFSSSQDAPKTSPGPSSSSKLLSPPTPSQVVSHHQTRETTKRRTGRRFRNAVILVPIVLIVITATARFLSHGPPSFISSLDLPHAISNVFSSTPCHAKDHHSNIPHATHERRAPSPQLANESLATTPTATTSGASTPTTSSPWQTQANQQVPTVPGSPPVLPTPFPQAYDGLISKNFSSVTCLNFMTDMLEAKAFRSCRPFSLLLQSSDEFVKAQTNLTLLNNLIWGTCNTNTPEGECISNMASYATNLRTQCANDLRDNNSMAVGTLRALEAYAVMRESACLTDPTTNTYCFVNAARDKNPTNLYYYSAPLGIKVPNSSDPQCTACLKSLMSVYGSALKDESTKKSLIGLQATYEKAAEQTLGKCGAGSAQANLVSAAIGSPLAHSQSAALAATGLLGLWALVGSDFVV